MYTGTMIEDLIATVEGAACDPEIFAPDEIGELPLAFLLEQSYGDQLVEVA